MKFRMAIYALSLLMLFAGCNARQKDSKQPSVDSEDIYTCSMHPQVLEHHPGNCPICGMKLVKKNPVPITTAISSLAVTSPAIQNMAIPVHAYGTIEYDTRTAATISARISGRIEKMYVRYRYQEIRKGQKLMDIYSPEILTAEQNLLFLLHSDAGNTSFIQAAKERLLLLGMGERQLHQVIQSGKPLYAVSIYSDYSGHIHDAGMMQDGLLQHSDIPVSEPLTQELSIKEGMYIQKGQTLLMIMDHHMVWAALQIFSSDESLVKVGNRVLIIPEADTSAVIKGNIDFMEPFFRSKSKTLTARVYFHNEDMLPIGSHVIATIYASILHSLWLPQTSVRSLGIYNVVFVKTSVGFIAHKITTGIRSGDDVEITAGLDEKDSVALNAQYFTDSESFIKSSN